jgi:hypothetical protein
MFYLFHLPVCLHRYENIAASELESFSCLFAMVFQHSSHHLSETPAKQTGIDGAGVFVVVVFSKFTVHSDRPVLSADGHSCSKMV